MEVKVASRERIKPSSPTPHHQRTFKLSLLDQLIPAPYAPLVFFYPGEDGATPLEVLKRLIVLKESLSETLTHFYPLAGKIEDDLTIDCNDEGACYVEAEVNCLLFDFLNQPDLYLIQRFLPCETSFNGSNAGTPVTNIQVSVFKCGGFAIGLCISHKILDGDAMSTFLKGWANTACGSKEVVYPNFVATSIFPTNDLWLRDTSIATWGSLFKVGNCTTRRFVFDASAIATLKAKAASSCVLNPTRVEAVSAFLWKCAMAASEEKSGFKRPSLLSHVVNLRRRTVPPLPENSMGNLIWIASAQSMAKYDKLGLHGLVGQVREGISKINSDFVKKLRGNERSSVIRKSLKRVEEFGSKDGSDYFGFTSWCKLGYYEANFGWGKPIWVSGVGLGGSVFMNLIVLMETRNDDGIEAWVTLDEEEMAILERDMELLTYASVDPSPLNLTESFSV
ncbi:stemmadenine O-acetyltransferase-like [Actinidia eriantha]|uniref:stemmadenine O-acetyltransferase-like n=1 Tax=Actinidia eriantha TaxID=165200 RepID=UPI00258BC1ED|nr:stemmadenine O-acetyltransferase-like [Actinidia eriantha]